MVNLENPAHNKPVERMAASAALHSGVWCLPPSLTSALGRYAGLASSLVAVASLIGFLAFAWIGLRFLARETARKGKWGINRNIVFCPDCGRQMPRFRIPRSLHQGLWGGWTCGACGCEIDKWGARIDFLVTGLNQDSSPRLLQCGNDKLWFLSRERMY
jgi:hypothetical protein